MFQSDQLLSVFYDYIDTCPCLEVPSLNNMDKKGEKTDFILTHFRLKSAKKLRKLLK